MILVAVAVGKHAGFAVLVLVLTLLFIWTNSRANEDAYHAVVDPLVMRHVVSDERVAVVTSVWLVERKVDDSPLWAKFSHGGVRWVFESCDATHFAREEDAKCMIFSGNNLGIEATEHHFDG